jgi:hypothetical protein
MQLKIPEINIKYGKLIDPFFIVYSQLKYPDWKPPTREEVSKKVKLFKEEWNKYGCNILMTIKEISGLDFVREVFDVYVVSGTPRDMSDPIIIRSRYEPDEFLDVLVHELLHRLLTLNKVKVPYEEENDTVRGHVYVHAIMKYIYLDLLKDGGRLERNLQRSKKHSTGDYIRAWEIVDDVGYMKLISQIKSSRLNI